MAKRPSTQSRGAAGAPAGDGPEPASSANQAGKSAPVSGEDGSGLQSDPSSKDTLTGGVGDDTVVGGQGEDTLTGRGGDDTLTGGVGDDTLTSREGDDTLAGSAASDHQQGGAPLELGEQIGGFIPAGERPVVTPPTHVEVEAKTRDGSAFRRGGVRWTGEVQTQPVRLELLESVLSERNLVVLTVDGSRDLAALLIR